MVRSHQPGQPFQIGPARRHRLETVRGVPTFCAARHPCRSPLRARARTDRVKVPSGVKLMPHRHPED